MAYWVDLTYALSVSAQAFCAIVAISVGFYWRKRKNTTEEYLTARRTAPVFRIAWSMFATGQGAWVVSTVPSYAAYAGAIGVVFYAISTGIPILILGLLGPKVQRVVPHVHSLADFARWRYGPTAKILVCLIVLFNVSVCLTVEYTTMGSIFQSYVDGNVYPIILSCAILTTLYTAYGGLGVAIVTDQIQGIAVIVLVIAMCIYLAAEFRQPLPQPFPEELGSTVIGWSSVFVMPCSMISSTVFSEPMWQRCWAAADDRTLLKGSLMGCLLAIAVVFIFGVMGLIGAWSGLITFDMNPNTYAFAVLRPEDTVVNSGIAVAVIVLACFANTGAVDSMQTGLTASITSHFLKGRSLILPQVITVLVQIPIVWVASLNLNALQMFVTLNMLTTTSAIPLVIGLHPRSEGYVTENSVIFAILSGLFIITAYGIGMCWNPEDVAGSFRYGAWMSWVGNGYLYDYFLVALLSSSVAGLLWIIVAQALARCGIHGKNISDILAMIPGWSYVNGDKSDEWYMANVLAERKELEELDGKKPLEGTQIASEGQVPTKV